MMKCAIRRADVSKTYGIHVCGTFYHELGHAFDSGVNGELFERIT